MNEPTTEPFVNLGEPARPAAIEMPAPTIWPLWLGAGMTLLATGLILGWAFSAVGAVLCLVALAGWIGELLPGRGHFRQELARPRPPAQPLPGRVEQMRPGLPGYRMRIPEKIHPYSAGVRGGIVGGLVMPIPAFLYGILSGNGIWYPINLLAGAVLPRFGAMPLEELQQFHADALVAGTVIHAVTSVLLGLIYGVLLPTLPGRPIVWGGIVLPLLWTGLLYGFMGVLNPLMARRVDWPWFILSQFVYGLAAGFVVVRSEKVYVSEAGVPPPEAGQGPDPAAPGQG